MTAALALAYFFWTQHRRSLNILGRYWLVVMILCHALPAGAFSLPPNGSLPPVLMVVVFPLLMAVVFPCSCLIATAGYLILIFTFGREARLDACASGFPARLWTLPLPTHALVGWPMLWGSAMMILLWLTLAWAVQPLCSFDVPLLWPGLLLAVLLAWWQAILWTPFPLRWLRVYLLIPVNTVLLSASMAVLELDVPSAAVCGLLAVLLSAAYGTALRGVTRARRGDNVQWGRPAWLRWPWAAQTRRPFASAARAQLWFEWRRCGLAFPLASALSWLPLVLFLIAWPEDVERLWCLLVPLISSLWLAAVCGAEMGKFPGHGEVRGFSSFMATRPLSTGMLARAKFEAAMLSTLAGWAVMLVGLMLWLALSGHSREIAEQIEAMSQRYPAGKFRRSLALLAGGSVVLIWMQMAGTLWVTLRCRVGGDCPRQTCLLQMAENMWVGFLRQVWSISSALGSVAVIILILFGWQVVGFPGPWRTPTELMPWLAGGAIVLKSLAAAWSLNRLKRNALVPSHVLIGAMEAWGALAISLLIALRWLIPREVMPTSGLVLGIVLFLPLTRLALAPLALAWNRHR